MNDAIEVGGGPHVAPAKDASSRRRVLVVSAALVLAVMVIYAPVREFEFLEWDDSGYVHRNEDVLQGLNGTSVHAAFTRTYLSNWTPLTILSHALDVSLWGVDPGMHHLTNVAFHALNSVLVFLVWYRMTGRLTESAILAALWAVHPQRVEPVAWIASRKDLLSTMLMLLALLVYQGYSTRGGRLRIGVVAILLALGLLAKPMLVTLPFALLLLDYWPLKRIAGRMDFLRRLAEKIPLFAICLLAVVITQRVQSEGGAVKSFEDISLNARLSNVPVAYAGYVEKASWPSRLSVHYPHAMGNTPLPTIAFATALVAALTLIAALQWRRRPYLFVGWFWFLGTLVPVIGLVQVGLQSMADRYTYVPHLGLFTAIVWLGAELCERRPGVRRTAVFLAIATLAAWAAISSRYVRVFENDVLLFTHVEDTIGPDPVALVNLAIGLTLRGAHSEAIETVKPVLDMDVRFANPYNNAGTSYWALNRLDRAYETFSEGLKRNPDDPTAQQNVDAAKSAIARTNASIDELKKRMLENPSDYDALRELSGLWLKVGALSEAERGYAFLTENRPGDLEAITGLAEICASTDRRERAVDLYKRALDLGGPNDVVLYRLGLNLHELDRDDEARTYLNDAVRLDPPSLDAQMLLRRMQPPQSSDK